MRTSLIAISTRGSSRIGVQTGGFQHTKSKSLVADPQGQNELVLILIVP